MANKKIKNATAVVADNIDFKSKLEGRVYQILSSLGYEVHYEPFTFVLWEGFKPTIPFYDQEVVHKRPTGNIKLNLKKIIDIKYTPDFVFEAYNPQNKTYATCFIEAKGLENDVFYIKKKLFRHYLEKIQPSTCSKLLYFEVHTLKQLKQSIEIIKQYGYTQTTNRGINSLLTAKRNSES